MGRTKGALNKKTLEEMGQDPDNATVIAGENNQTYSKKSTGRLSVKKELIADKLNIACDGFASILGYEYTFTSDDYKKESLALESLSRDYSIVAKIIEFLDPLFLVFGIWQKFKSLKKKPKPEKKQPQQTSQPQPNISQQPVERGNLLNFKIGG